MLGNDWILPVIALAEDLGLPLPQDIIKGPLYQKTGVLRYFLFTQWKEVRSS